jgi:sigma-B regulation protein RsbU (phosphoserine phosphatase)
MPELPMSKPMQLPGEISPASAPAARLSVLLVDDGAENRLLLSAILDWAGYKVLMAEDGPSGLALLRRERVDLLVLDYMMPGMDGAEVARRVRQDAERADLPIIMLTASQEEPDIEAAFAAGANDYLTKPVDRRILVARVASMIKAAQDHRRASAAAQLEGERQSLLTELEEAARIQQARLPRLPVTSGGWALAGALVPSRHIGGDVLDVMVDGAGSQVLALVDVSGHGLGAALVAAAISAQLRELVARHPLAEAVHQLNNQLCRESDGKYACLAVLSLQDAHIVAVNAGLPPVCLVRQGICTSRFQRSGFPPGLMRDAPYQAQTSEVRPGDRLVLMSDGITEPFGNAAFVEPPLQKLGLLAPDLHLHTLSSAELSDRIGVLLREANPVEVDDATLLMAQRLGGPPA